MNNTNQGLINLSKPSNSVVNPFNKLNYSNPINNNLISNNNNNANGNQYNTNTNTNINQFSTSININRNSGKKILFKFND